MIQCVFTIDYEIYGNGTGSLRELVYQPTCTLIDIFNRFNTKIVVFVETAELEKIENFRADSAIDDVKNQVYDLYTQGHEIGLHLHPQWCNARYGNGKWELDQREYNLCVLSNERIRTIVGGSIKYLQSILKDSKYTPLSFRAGNWLLQPTQQIVTVLAEMGIKIDSSVYKGGLQRQYKLDYRAALKNGYFWKFSNDVNTHNPNGELIELPIHTKMVPFWKMATMKRVCLQQKGLNSSRSFMRKVNRFLDMLRYSYPLKFDFCRMNINELTHMIDQEIERDKQSPHLLKPIVAIGHTKDLNDFKTVELFLNYLKEKNIQIATLKEIYKSSAKT